jgi:hypothetical protein
MYRAGGKTLHSRALENPTHGNELYDTSSRPSACFLSMITFPLSLAVPYSVAGGFGMICNSRAGESVGSYGNRSISSQRMNIPFERINHQITGSY